MSITKTVSIAIAAISVATAFGAMMWLYRIDTEAFEKVAAILGAMFN